MNIELFSALKPDECLEILKKNLKSLLDFIEFRGKVKENKFWIVRFTLENAGIRYGPPKFRGEILPHEDGSLIRGYFTDQWFIKIFDVFSKIFVGVIGLFFVLSAISDLVFKTHIIDESRTNTFIIALFISVGLIIFVFIFQKYCHKLRIQDMEKIKEFLLTKLEAKDVARVASFQTSHNNRLNGRP